MKDRVNQDIGATKLLQDWEDIDWKPIEKRVRNLRQRIFRATECGQWNKVRSLMKLMLRSYSNLLQSVRKVTQKNKGRKTAGVDNQKVLTPKARVKLVREMLKFEAWKVKPARRVYIPKAGGRQRPLGILTIKNRVAQAVVKNALEPSWEARFEPNSYGFRPGRSCHDALQQCWLRLNKGSTHQWVLDADIRAAFDNIRHDLILERLGQVPGRELIRQWLKAGYLEAEILHDTASGVPQGGVISPVLANIALDGLETLLTGRAGFSRRTDKRKPAFIRYADDFIVTMSSREELEALVPTIEKFFVERGLELNTEKTKIVHVKDGFNFLGFTVRCFNSKCIIQPQKEKVQELLSKVRQWLKSHKMAPTPGVIKYLNPILRGWANYYKYMNSKSIFKYVDAEVWKALWKWCLRRHPKKSRAWVYKKYFRRVDDRNWKFYCTMREPLTGVQYVMQLYCMADTKIVRYVKVSGKASPDNPELRDYWKKRAERRRCSVEEIVDTSDMQNA